MGEDVIHCRGEKPFAPCVNLGRGEACLAHMDRVEDREAKICDMIPINTIAVQFV